MKLIYFIIGFIILAEIIGGIYYLTRPVQNSRKNQEVSTSDTSTPSTDTSLSVLASGPIAQNTEFTASLELQTKDPTDGTDVIVVYDPAFLTPMPAAANTIISPGSLYQDYPVNNLVSPGRINFSAVIKPNTSGFSGKGILGTIRFKALKKGLTNIEIEYTPGSTSDSNIISTQTGSDILQRVENAKILIE